MRCLLLGLAGGRLPSELKEDLCRAAQKFFLCFGWRLSIETLTAVLQEEHSLLRRLEHLPGSKKTLFVDQLVLEKYSRQLIAQSAKGDWKKFKATWKAICKVN